MDETLEKYEKLQKKYEKLKDKFKYVQKWLKSDGRHIMELEAEILDINTKTMQDIIENNKRFNNN